MPCAPEARPAGRRRASDKPARASRLLGIVLSFAAAAPLTTWSAEAPPVAVAGAQTMVLHVRLNSEDKGDLFIARTPQQDFLIRIEDLKAMGFREPSGTQVMYEGEPHMSLSSMRGVSFEYQESALALNLSAEPGLLPSQRFQQSNEHRPKGIVLGSRSGFVNYALSTYGGDGAPSGSSLSAEAGWREGDFLLLSDASTAETTGGQRKFVRLMSSITHDDRASLRRTVVGDFFTPSREFSTGVNLGGFSLSKLYGLDPYFVRFPTQSVTGNVALPSDLEVYLDGQRIRSEKLKPGEFELRDILAYGGARNVQLVLRDAFGRVQQLNYSFYFSDQPLRAGLHEYSYNLGAIRRGYGLESHHYGPGAYSMFHRYGFSDAVSLGLRAEGTRDLVNAGPTATVVMGNAGIVNLAMSASSIAGRHGAAVSASYNYQARNWSFGSWLRMDSRRYAALGDPPVMANRRHEGNVVASYHLAQRGSVSLSYSSLATRDGATSFASPTQPFNTVALEARRATTLGYSAPLVSGRATFTASVSRVKDGRDKGGRTEAFVGVMVYLDKDYSFGASVRRENSVTSQSLQFTKNQPIGEGLGYVLSTDHAAGFGSDTVNVKSSAQYNAPAAVLRADLGRHTGQGQSVGDYRLSVAGGVAYVPGSIGFGRPITDSFGIVKVGDVAGVEVMVNGQAVGTTDSRGNVFVPNLSAYYDNDVSIAPESVPIEYSMAATNRIVSPLARSGAIIDFPVARVQAFSGRLRQHAAGRNLPVEFSEIRLGGGDKPQLTRTGRGGEFYLENLKPGTYSASAWLEGKTCLFELKIPQSDQMFVDVGVVDCQPAP